ncbi:MAG: 3-methyl-2-oxobutanoate hydroxymethyltransferase [bacterium]|nr:3-methyl-2-oxobutanoate hydroxymethyltransferase [bacterium]
MKNKIHPVNIIQKKKEKIKIKMLTAYDFTLAVLLDKQNIDIVLIGDSLGNLFNGYQNTIPVTFEEMLYHTKAVSKACERALVVSDMPFLSYQISAEQAKENAGLLIKEGGAQAVKMEVSGSNTGYIKDVIDIGVPVMGHLGFTPQSIYQLGGYRVQGKTDKECLEIFNTARQLENIGCFAIVLEMVPRALAKKITSQLDIPVIGIGAGKDCDGQVLVTHDLTGMNNDAVPRFVKQYSDVNSVIKEAIDKYIKDVDNMVFPDQEHSY